jgi:hypothetical protein
MAIRSTIASHLGSFSINVSGEIFVPRFNLTAADGGIGKTGPSISWMGTRMTVSWIEWIEGKSLTNNQPTEPRLDDGVGTLLSKGCYYRVKRAPENNQRSLLNNAFLWSDGILSMTYENALDPYETG